MEEQIINGVLHWKHKDGRWIPYSQKQLTNKLVRTVERFYKQVSSDSLPEMMKDQAS